MGSSLSAVLVSPVGRENKMTWAKLLAILLLAHCVAGARKLRGNRGSPRNAKSLVNTFPFNANQNEDHHAHHGDHGDHADGKRCIDKVEMVEETEYDDVVQCDHSYDKRCHTTYVTNYESQQ